MQYYTDKDEKDVETSIKSGFISFMSKNHVQIFSWPQENQKPAGWYL